MAASTPAPLDWDGLAKYAATPFPHGWDPDQYVFFSPRDPGVHQAIRDIVASASHSILANHYGFDDDEISALMLQKSADPNIAFLLNLDSSQAGGVHEKRILAAWKDHVGTSVAVGRSIAHAISHLKVTVVDGLYVISGSTNLSQSGEQKQDNELRVTRDPLMAARYSSVIMLNHAAMLAQMRA
jgi:phosphatidylserine/phosphatidylglycerophosphate/cardiolipin synthase-like enzyme